MAENQNGAKQSDPNSPQVGVIMQYVKDLSFENPNAPQSFNIPEGEKPNIEVNINVNGRKIGEDTEGTSTYEVELKVTASSEVTGSKAFVVELVYAGLFALKNMPEDALQPFMLVQAPVMLFPFARRVIADATRDGGYPPLLLDPIDFASLFQQQAAQETKKTPVVDVAAKPN